MIQNFLSQRIRHLVCLIDDDVTNTLLKNMTTLREDEHILVSMERGLIHYRNLEKGYGVSFEICNSVITDDKYTLTKLEFDNSISIKYFGEERLQEVWSDIVRCFFIETHLNGQLY